MPDLETLSERVGTLERALTDGELPELQDGTELRRTTAELSTRLAELEAKQDELDAAILALRGYVGNVRAVNDDVERRADAALATAERCQERLENHEFRDSRDTRDFSETRDFPPDPHQTDSETNSNTDRQGTVPSEIPPLESVESGNHTESDDRSLTTRVRELL